MMRRILMLVALAAGALGVAACEPAPKVTITAKAPSKGYCGTAVEIKGTVTPSDATPKVVLQRTEGGKWVDWIWVSSGSSSEKPHRISATVDGGEYSSSFYMPISKNVLHLRVRSNGGSVVSNGVYVTPAAVDPYQCG